MLSDAIRSVMIVVLNWNNAPDTISCLRSVCGLEYSNYSVLVVDNGSTDDSVSQIHASFPDVELIETGENLGYAEGNNVGIRHAVSANPDFVMVLNNDTLVERHMLDHLVDFAEAHPRAAMIGPKVMCTDPPDILFALGSRVEWDKGQVLHRGLFQPAERFQEITEPERVDFLVGCGVMVRRDYIDTAGLLDPEYFLNFEDVDWGIRTGRFDREVWVVPQALLWHKVSATLGLGSPANTYYMTRNALRFFLAQCAERRPVAGDWTNPHQNYLDGRSLDNSTLIQARRIPPQTCCEPDGYTGFRNRPFRRNGQGRPRGVLWIGWTRA